jgi:hypothetical protein
MNKEIIDKIRSLSGIDTFPELPCPYCADGRLHLSKKDIRSRRLRNQFDKADFEDINFESHIVLNVLWAAVSVMHRMVESQAKFSAFLQCKSCHETVIMVGKALVPSEWANERGTYVRVRIVPEYFTPPLPMIPLPINCPESLRKDIIRSFSTFFSDPASCGNAIRHSVETLLDEQKVDRVRVSGNGNSVFLPLSERIELFGKR